MTTDRSQDSAPAVHLLADRGLLVDCADLDAVLALTRWAEARRRPPGPRGAASRWAVVTDVVPAARTVLVLTRPGTSSAVLHALAADVRRRSADAPGATDAPAAPGGTTAGPREVRIPVRYDGPDLDAVARSTGLTTADVVAAHTGTPWRAAFGGFAPGFCYLTGGDPRLRVPRRTSPRTRVPAGAVALAGEFSGVYPRESPGGWQLIGTTERRMWDPARTPPALVAPGDTVRFVAVGPESSGGAPRGRRAGES